MAIYHCSIKNISRGKGQSAVASSAYRSADKLEDMETGIIHDYRKKNGVVFSEVILCKYAPESYQNRETLWNAVHKVESQSNARLAREWEVAIPNELDLEQSKKLVHEFAQSLADEGMCVDANIHWKQGNHHAHILGTTRPLTKNGTWGQKEKKGYKLDESGQKIPIIDSETGLQKIGAKGRKMWQRVTVEANDWNKTEKVEEWRMRWAQYCNQYLEPNLQIDHRSYERQGKEQIPTIHEGYVARKMEQKGVISSRCETNRNIRKYNLLSLQFDKLSELKETLVKQLEELREKAKGALHERLQRLRATRAVDEPTRRDADAAIEKRLATLRSIGQGGESLPGTEESAVQDIIREARAGIDRATAKEENSRTGRSDREAEQQRCDISTKSGIRETKHSIAKEHPKRPSRGRSR